MEITWLEEPKKIDESDEILPRLLTKLFEKKNRDSLRSKRSRTRRTWAARKTGRNKKVEGGERRERKPFDSEKPVRPRKGLLIGAA